jgi:glycosyltransferase involved in cell wall biosynthesis
VHYRIALKGKAGRGTRPHSPDSFKQYQDLKHKPRPPMKHGGKPTDTNQTPSLVNITCIILTFNEEINIARAIRSLSWVDDLIIVDSNSTDKTTQIAREKRPNARIYTREFSNFGEQRNWSLDNCVPKHEWVLFLDADEESTNDFAYGVKNAIEHAKGEVGFFLTYKNFLFGKWLKRSTFYPSWQLRLLKLGQVRFRAEGHGQAEVTSGKLGRLAVPYNHYPFEKGITAWLEKHNHYSTKECDLIEKLRRTPFKISQLLSRDPILRRRCIKTLASRLWFRPFIRLFYTYILRGGFLDGYPGYIYCRLIAQYEFQLWVKLKERQWRIQNQH